MDGTEEIPIAVGSKEYYQDTVDCLSKCFDNDPVIRFTLNHMTEEQRKAVMPQWFAVLTKAAMLNQAFLVGAGGFTTSAIIMPPGKYVDNWRTNFQAGLIQLLAQTGSKTVWRMLVDFPRAVDPVKKKALAAHPKYYYVFFIATLESGRGRGQASALMRHWQTKAAVEGIPIWLEATTPRSHELYQHLGFQDAGEICIGKGKVDANGYPKKKGEGVTHWGMIWVPPAQAEPEVVPEAAVEAAPGQ